MPTNPKMENTSEVPMLSYMSQMDSMKDILEIAINFEHTERDFYIDLRKRLSGPLYDMLTILAHEEQLHCDRLIRLRNSDEINDYLNMHLKRTTVDATYTSYAQLPDFENDLSEKNILKFAIEREDIAMKEYRSLARRLPAGKIKEVFNSLADEELEHRVELERKYTRLLANRV